MTTEILQFMRFMSSSKFLQVSSKFLNFRVSKFLCLAFSKKSVKRVSCSLCMSDKGSNKESLKVWLCDDVYQVRYVQLESFGPFSRA